MSDVAKLTLPMFIGSIFNWALFSTLLAQAYVYFSVFPKDRTWWKLIVVLIVFLEVVETFSSLRDMVHIFGAGWGHPEALDDVGWAWFSVPVMGAIISFVCQTFYGWRIYIIGHSPFMFALIVLFSFVELGAGIWTGVEICIAKKFSVLQSSNLRATATWLAGMCAADLLIIVGTIFSLRRSRTDPEFTSAKTNSIISRIIRLTAETGGLCMVFVLVDIYLFASYKGTNYHLAVCIELSKIYSNSILLIFNSRAHMGHGCSNDTDDYSGVNLSTSLFNRSKRSTTASAPIEIGVHVSRSDANSDYGGKRMEC